MQGLTGSIRAQASCSCRLNTLVCNIPCAAIWILCAPASSQGRNSSGNPGEAVCGLSEWRPPHICHARMQGFRTVGQSPMDFTFQEVALIVLVGIIAGLLPGTVAERRGTRVAADIGAGVTAVFVVAWLATAWHKLDLFLTTPAGTPPEKKFVDVKPGFEPVILPLAPLKPLLKPVVFRSREEVCDALVESALNHDLPVPFFIRLLYQESTFRPAAISSAGALGIAQFMPETAAHRRLDNPFDPAQAIPASARLLRDHYRKYG